MYTNYFPSSLLYILTTLLRYFDFWKKIDAKAIRKIQAMKRGNDARKAAKIEKARLAEEARLVEEARLAEVARLQALEGKFIKSFSQLIIFVKKYNETNN